MLLNFLIAILTNTHAKYSELQRSLYLKEVILKIKRAKFNPHYSCLISMTPPFNLFLLPFVPLILYMKSERLNNFFLKIEYSMLILIALGFYLLFIIFMIPLAFLYILYTKFAKVFMGNYKGFSEFLLRALDSLSFLLFGPFILLIWTFQDIYFFVAYLFVSEIRSKYTENNFISGNKVAAKNSKEIPNILKRRISSVFGTTYQLPVTISDSNPIKAGLADISLQIMKITMEILMKDMNIYQKKNRMINS